MFKRLHDYFFPENEEWTRKEKILAIAVYSSPLWISLVWMLFTESPRSSGVKAPASPYYERTERPQVQTTGKKTISIPESEENKLLKQIDRGDYYEEKDYHDGLDGQYNDIDFAELEEYFED